MNTTNSNRPENQVRVTDPSKLQDLKSIARRKYLDVQGKWLNGEITKEQRDNLLNNKGHKEAFIERELDLIMNGDDDFQESELSQYQDNSQNFKF